MGVDPEEEEVEEDEEGATELLPVWATSAFSSCKPGGEIFKLNSNIVRVNLLFFKNICGLIKKINYNWN